MTPNQHQQKVERIERSLAKCTTAQYELVIEGAMLAGTHWFNIALHRINYFPPENDVMHAQYLSGDHRLKISLLQPEMLSALDEIESLRPGYVRGDLPNGVAAAERSLELLGIIRRAATRSPRCAD